MSEESLTIVEEYLVRVWTGARRKTSSKIFDQARPESHMKDAYTKATGTTATHVKRNSNSYSASIFHFAQCRQPPE